MSMMMMFVQIVQAARAGQTVQTARVALWLSMMILLTLMSLGNAAYEARVFCNECLEHFHELHERVFPNAEPGVLPCTLGGDVQGHP